MVVIFHVANIHVFKRLETIHKCCHACIIGGFERRQVCFPKLTFGHIDRIIIASADSRTTANFEGRSLAVTASAALPAGPAMLIARAEALRLASGVDGVPNCVAGTLRRAQYLGARTHHQIVTEGGQIVMVESQGAAHAAFRPGDRVNVAFDPDQTLVVAS